MSCLLTKGFTLGCKDVLGGIKDIYLGNLSDFATGITFDNVTGMIDGLPTATLYRYQLARNSSSFNEVATLDEVNGTAFWLQTLTATLRTLSQDKRNELENAARANPIIFVRDVNNKIFVMGRQLGSTFGWTGQTGQAKGDLNGYAINATAEEGEPAEFLEAYTTVPFDNFGGITVTPGENS
jgi:hypothetical protein